jgi:hypothetical protein
MGLIFVRKGHLCQHVVTYQPEPIRGVVPNPEKGDFCLFAETYPEKRDLWSYLDKSQQDKGGFWQPLTRKNVTGEQGER